MSLLIENLEENEDIREDLKKNIEQYVSYYEKQKNWREILPVLFALRFDITLQGRYMFRVPVRWCRKLLCRPLPGARHLHLM